MTSPSPPLEDPSGSPSASSTQTTFEPSFVVSARVRNTIALVITVVWVAAFVADVGMESFETSPFIHMAMLGLAAAIFGSGFVKGIK